MKKIKRIVPQVLWKVFRNRARTLAETILSLIPPPSSATVQCLCKGSGHCLRCCCDGDRMSFLFRENDPSDYRKLLNQCFVVVSDSDNAPSPPPFDPHSRWFQLELVRRTVEMISCEKVPTKNVICTGYNKYNRSSIFLEALTSASWSLLLQRIGDGLMVYLLKHSSIFMPLHRKKHHQVAGIPITDLCWKLLKHPSDSKTQHPAAGVPERYHEVDSNSKNDDNAEYSTSCHGDPIIGTDCTGTAQENAVVAVAQSGKRLRPYAWQRRSKRRKWSSQDMCDANCSLPEKKVINFPQMKFPCSCCSVWQTLQKVPRGVHISKRTMLYKLERASSILPGEHIINSLRPNVAGANALFKEIFGLTEACIAAPPTPCSHSNDICISGTTCLYHSLHKLLKILIRKANHCRRLRLLNKHIFIPSLDPNPREDHHDSYCSKRQVVSFIWAACRSIVPRELLGTPSNWRILRKNISMFIRLRIYEKFSIHQCLRKLKTSNYPFLLDEHSLCNSIIKRNLLERWTYWFFKCLVVPLVQANFYITESEHGKLDVFFYEKSLWEKLMKSSLSCLKEQCYSLLDVNAVKSIVSARSFGFSRVRFLPKANGIRPLANLRSSSRLPLGQSSLQAYKRWPLRHPLSHSRRDAYKEFKAVNVVLRDLHAALKDVQLQRPETLGSSVFSYNDVHRKFRDFISRINRGLNTLPCVYLVVADVRKAYDSIDQDKLLLVMKDVITDDHLLHQTHQVIVSNRYMQVCQYINLSRQFRSHVHACSSHSILVNQGRSRTARKEDLHFNLQQHVKYNVLHIDKKFYLQNVGIPQGSILSSLLCSFYFGHMENCKLVPFLDKVTKTGMPESSDRRCIGDHLLLRFIDDFLFISTSKKQALAFFSRLERGFCDYNCNMNREKFGFSFDVDNIKPQSNRVYIDEDGNKFLRWSGLFINCKTLEVQADYTRYLDAHLSSTLTVCWQGNPGRHFSGKLCDYLRPKCHAIFYDSNINSAAVVRLNIHQAFLLCAMKFHCYICDLSDICSFDSGSYMNIIHNSLRFMYKLMKKQMYSLDVDPSLRPILKVKKREVEWLGLTAYFQVLQRKQSRYKELLSLLKSQLKSWNEGRVSSVLKFAADKSNSSVLWKIKY
ncbi:telomerase reverse transcriptase [Cynara cardunculus var. scolymus]|uniref:telomerase reverse transcriptase n=1 Tax=Cynara cardunculus var. scolymus TaxID=59895 RepID=UPI000D62D2A8|nr:telomerase reverse transcriptase [Cynara cardunculus var. scolymus]